MKIIDENDNAPEFSQALHVGHVMEGLPENSPVIGGDGKPLVIHATDADVSSSDLMYEVVGCSAFSIDPHSGALVTAEVRRRGSSLDPGATPKFERGTLKVPDILFCEHS